MKVALRHCITRNSFYTLANIRKLTSWKKEYSEQNFVRFSVHQMYDVVSDVENYEKFLPFCKKSVVYKKTDKELLGELQVGFPPLVETYTSKVTLQRPHLVKADCSDGRLFHHLTALWRFANIEGIDRSKRTNSCKVYFYLSFEFKSLLHSQVANLFFDQLVSQMKTAFFTEAFRRYGGLTSDITLNKNKHP